MNKDRLLRLAKLLRDDAANPTGVKFDLGEWGSSSNGDYHIDCGTTACAAGLAVLSGIFKDEGLGYQTRLSLLDGKHILVPTFEDATAHNAIMDFFELPPPDMFYIFMPQSYPANKRRGAEGELAAAEKIEKFVATGVFDD